MFVNRPINKKIMIIINIYTVLADAAGIFQCIAQIWKSRKNYTSLQFRYFFVSRAITFFENV